MIIPSHSFLDAISEAKKDYESITFRHKELGIKKELDKRFRKRRDYPLMMNTIWTHPESKNKWLLTAMILNKAQHRNPKLLCAVMFERPSGKYVLMPTAPTGPQTWMLFPPHFFKRYRERICGDENLSIMDVITRYFERNYVTGADMNNVTGGFHYNYGNLEDMKNDFVGKVSEGTVFGSYYKLSIYNTFIIMKTIVRNDMLFKEQHELYDWMEDDMKAFMDEFATRK